MRPTLLALDPGMTTGYCLFYEDAPVNRLVTGTFGYPPLTMVGTIRWLMDCDSKAVVIERLPNKLSMDMKVIECQLLEAFPGSVRVAPTTWKPITGRDPLPIQFLKMATTQHERDAYRMGLYWLKFGRGKGHA